MRGSFHSNWADGEDAAEAAGDEFGHELGGGFALEVGVCLKIGAETWRKALGRE